jgi:hypothetical protein
MEDFESMMVTGDDLQQLSQNLTRILQSLPDDARIRLRKIRKDYLIKYEFMDFYHKMNNKTVAQIFAEYSPGETKPIAAGEIDGVQYELHESPRDRIEIPDQRIDDGDS